MPLEIRADEITLKDGRKVEWKSISDEGDVYEIVTVQGTKLSIRKDEVEGFTKTKAPQPLTGGTFTFDKKRKLETIDLLTKCDPKRALSGQWRFAGAALVGAGSGGTIAKLEIDHTPADEYDLTATMERKDGADGIGVGLIGGGNQFVIFLDGLAATWSGIWTIDGKGGESNGSGIPGRFFVNATPRTLRFMVRKEGVVVQADGKDWMAWKADWSKIGMMQPHAVSKKNVLFLECLAGTFQVTQLKLSYPK